MNKKLGWTTYIIECSDKTLYTGITIDLEKRVNEHNSAGSKTKYTRVRQPSKLVYSEECKDRSTALKREIRIKGYTRTKKLELIRSYCNCV